MKQIIRGGRVLTAGRLDGGYADILIDGGAILAILPAGEPVTEDAPDGRCKPALAYSRPCQ